MSQITRITDSSKLLVRCFLDLLLMYKHDTCSTSTLLDVINISVISECICHKFTRKSPIVQMSFQFKDWIFCFGNFILHWVLVHIFSFGPFQRAKLLSSTKGIAFKLTLSWTSRPTTSRQKPSNTESHAFHLMPPCMCENEFLSYFLWKKLPYSRHDGCIFVGFGWVDGRCMCLRPIKLKLLWPVNQIAACNSCNVGK